MGGVVLIHVDIQGIMQGNGGYVGLVSLYRQLARMGYSPYFLDLAWNREETRLIDTTSKAAYLCADAIPVVGLAWAEKQKPVGVVSLWMNADLYKTIVRLSWEDAFLFWDMGQLLRERYLGENRRVRALLAYNRKPLLILNRYLIPVYRERLGYGSVLPLDGWVRDDFFTGPIGARPEYTIGYQDEVMPLAWSGRSEERMAAEVASAIERFTALNGLSALNCGGTHRDVATKMALCKFFIWANERHVNPDMFQGETLGYALIEALCSGCVVIARRNFFTRQILPDMLLVESVGEALDAVYYYEKHPGELPTLAERCAERARDYLWEGFADERARTLRRVLETRNVSLY